MPARICWLISGVSLPAVMSVAMKPGQMALTRTLSGASSARHGLRKAQDARLGSGVVRAAEDAAATLRRYRAEVDDAAGFARPHFGNHRLAHVQGAAQVDVEDGVIVLGLDFHDLQWLSNTGVVHQNIDLPPSVFQLRYSGIAGGLVDDVAGDPHMVRPQIGGCRLRCAGVEVENRDGCAMIGI